MKKQLYTRAFLALLCAGTAGLLPSCSNDDDTPEPTPGPDAETSYVIAAHRRPPRHWSLMRPL